MERYPTASLCKWQGTVQEKQQSKNLLEKKRRHKKSVKGKGRKAGIMRVEKPGTKGGKRKKARLEGGVSGGKVRRSLWRCKS